MQWHLTVRIQIRGRLLADQRYIFDEKSRKLNLQITMILEVLTSVEAPKSKVWPFIWNKNKVESSSQS